MHAVAKKKWGKGKVWRNGSAKLRVLAALPEDPGSIFSTHSHRGSQLYLTPLPGDLVPSSGL